MTAPQAACPGRGRPSPDCCGVNSSTWDVTRWLAGAVAVHLPARDGWYDLLATDPRWRDNIPFHEYFHGDTGMGLGAEHQTGWTALAAHLIITTPPR